MVALGSISAAIAARYLSLVTALAGQAGGFPEAGSARVCLNRVAATALGGPAVLVVVGHWSRWSGGMASG